MEIKTIGVLGLGAMGYPMANHLINKGYRLRIIKNSNKKESLEKIDSLVEKGAELWDNIKTFPQGLDVIMSILPGDKEVNQVFLDEDFQENINADTIVLEMTSCSAGTIENIDSLYSKKGIRLVDAPVSGGVQGATRGELTIFGSGNKEAFNKLDGLLKSFAKKIYYIGQAGAGKTLKSINQMMISINTLGLIEGYSLAAKKGIDPEIMEEVVGDSSGNSYALHRYIDRLKNNDFDGGFKLKLMRKDILVALESGEGIPLPFTDMVKNYLLMAEDYDDLDFSAVSKLYNIE